MIDPPKHEACGLSPESRLYIVYNIKLLFKEKKLGSKVCIQLDWQQAG
jgi:hypothetical protein